MAEEEEKKEKIKEFETFVEQLEKKGVEAEESFLQLTESTEQLEKDIREKLKKELEK